MKDCRDNLVYLTKLERGKKIVGKLTLTKIVDKLEADYEVCKKLIFLVISRLRIFTVNLVQNFSTLQMTGTGRSSERIRMPPILN